MLTDKVYDYENGLITFSQGEPVNGLDVFCRLEGMDYQHVVSESRLSRLMSAIRKKQPKAKSSYNTTKN